jgi:hypothetical protein
MQHNWYPKSEPESGSNGLVHVDHDASSNTKEQEMESRNDNDNDHHSKNDQKSYQEGIVILIDETGETNTETSKDHDERLTPTKRDEELQTQAPSIVQLRRLLLDPTPPRAPLFPLEKENDDDEEQDNDDDDDEEQEQEATNHHGREVISSETGSIHSSSSAASSSSSAASQEEQQKQEQEPLKDQHQQQHHDRHRPQQQTRHHGTASAETETWGVPQQVVFPSDVNVPRIPNQEAVLTSKAYETNAYMRRWFSSSSSSSCRNFHCQCTYWAVTGECTTHSTFMSTECAPSCQVCFMHLYQRQWDYVAFPSHWSNGSSRGSSSISDGDDDDDEPQWINPNDPNMVRTANRMISYMERRYRQSRRQQGQQQQQQQQQQASCRNKDSQCIKWASQGEKYSHSIMVLD